jgi:hypothetical protein
MSIKGYKVFNPDWTCRGFQYEVGKTFKYDGNIEMCGAGFHFCQKVSDCFNYYNFDSNNKVAEVEAVGRTETRDDKSVTDEITIIKELTWYEVLDLANTGRGCTGNRNSGDCNSGNRNSGNRNSGNRNSGNLNSGNCNSGNRNSGDCNSGNRNSGNRNSGNLNSGNRNSGDWNSGDCNSGDWNSGNRNSGNLNSGNCNSGDWNSGDWNSTNYSTGFFNSIEQPIYIFNKLADITRDAFNNILAVRAMRWKYENNWWIYSENMTDEEKIAHPEHETTGGYLKTVDFKTACRLMWETMTEDERTSVRDIPNFDANIFEEITGIKVEQNE